jgi:hypothetical protein
LLHAGALALRSRAGSLGLPAAHPLPLGGGAGPAVVSRRSSARVGTSCCVPGATPKSRRSGNLRQPLMCALSHTCGQSNGWGRVTRTFSATWTIRGSSRMSSPTWTSAEARRNERMFVLTCQRPQRGVILERQPWSEEATPLESCRQIPRATKRARAVRPRTATPVRSARQQRPPKSPGSRQGPR